MKRICCFIFTILIVAFTMGCDTEVNGDYNSTSDENTLENEVSKAELPETENSKGIEITVENFYDYFTTYCYIRNPTFTEGMYVQSMNNGMGVYLNDRSTTFYLFDYFDLSIGIQGASPSLIYEDVVVKCRIVGNYYSFDLFGSKSWDNNELRHDLVLDCNIAGTVILKDKLQPARIYVHEKMIEYQLEIVEVSGYVIMPS